MCTDKSGKSILLNSGGPQGYVLSQNVFVLYTSDLAYDNNVKVFTPKYAADTVVVSLCDCEEDAEYLNCLDYLKDKFKCRQSSEIKCSR